MADVQTLAGPGILVKIARLSKAEKIQGKDECRKKFWGGAGTTRFSGTFGHRVRSKEQRGGRRKKREKLKSHAVIRGTIKKGTIGGRGRKST